MTIEVHPTHFNERNRYCTRPQAWTAVVTAAGETRVIAGAATKRHALQLGAECAARMGAA